jgi:hypothetical protein
MHAWLVPIDTFKAEQNAQTQAILHDSNAPVISFV